VTHPTSCCSYTMESPFYRELNKSLRDRNRNELKRVFFPALKLLVYALNKLPRVKSTVCTVVAGFCVMQLRYTAAGVSRSQAFFDAKIFASNADRSRDCLARDADARVVALTFAFSFFLQVGVLIHDKDHASA
jgi:hypothetical protein